MQTAEQRGKTRSLIHALLRGMHETLRARHATCTRAERIHNVWASRITYTASFNSTFHTRENGLNENEVNGSNEKFSAKTGAVSNHDGGLGILCEGMRNISQSIRCCFTLNQ
jgi:hypothetical protein